MLCFDCHQRHIHIIYYTIEYFHISATAYCIKVEVGISMRSIFCLNKNGLRGRTIWQGPRKVSEISHAKKRQRMDEIKKFLCEVDRHEKSDFSLK